MLFALLKMIQINLMCAYTVLTRSRFIENDHLVQQSGKTIQYLLRSCYVLVVDCLRR